MWTIAIFVATLIGRPVADTSGSAPFLDPTGTYVLKGSTHREHIIGHFGEIRVKLLEPQRIALSLDINKGYPHYESAFFSDTLDYLQNSAHLRSPADTQCTISFHFNQQQAVMTLVYSNPRCSCGFDKGVLVAARFAKYSNDVPVIRSARDMARLEPEGLTNTSP